MAFSGQSAKLLPAYRISQTMYTQLSSNTIQCITLLPSPAFRVQKVQDLNFHWQVGERNMTSLSVHLRRKTEMMWFSCHQLDWFDFMQMAPEVS